MSIRYFTSSSIEVSPTTDLTDEMIDIFVHHDLGQELKPNMVVYLSFCVTKEQHSGQGLASRLATVVCKHTRDTKRFQYALVHVSNAATCHIYLNKLSGKIVTETDLTTWQSKNKDDGSSCPFKNYKGQPMLNILVNLTSE
jgi:hypothetical protein